MKATGGVSIAHLDALVHLAALGALKRSRSIYKGRSGTFRSALERSTFISIQPSSRALTLNPDRFRTARCTRVARVAGNTEARLMLQDLDNIELAAEAYGELVRQGFL